MYVCNEPGGFTQKLIIFLLLSALSALSHRKHRKPDELYANSDNTRKSVVAHAQQVCDAFQCAECVKIIALMRCSLITKNAHTSGFLLDLFSHKKHLRNYDFVMP